MIRPNIKVKLVSQMKGHKDAIYDFVYDKKCNLVYSVGADGYIVSWDMDNPEQGKLILTASEALYSVNLEDNLLQAGSRSGMVYRVDLENKKLVAQSSRHKGGVFFIRGESSGGEDGMLFSKDADSKKVTSDSLRCYAEDRSYFYIGSSNNNIYQLRKETLETAQIFSGHTNSVFSLELLDENTLVSTGRDAKIRAWDLTIGKEVHAVPAHEYQAKSLSWNGELLLSSSMDKTIKVWNDQLDLLKVIDFERYKGHTNCINKVLWIDENLFVSCSDDRTLCLWKVEIMP